MIKVTDSVKHKGTMGQLIESLFWDKVDTAMEPNGFYYGIYNWVVEESWFHPYNGAMPERLSKWADGVEN